MNQDEFKAAVAQRMGSSKSLGRRAIKAVSGVIADELARGGDVILPSVGSFKSVTRPPRKLKNPLTGEIQDIDTRAGAKFVISRLLLKKMRGK